MSCSGRKRTKMGLEGFMKLEYFTRFKKTRGLWLDMTCFAVIYAMIALNSYNAVHWASQLHLLVVAPWYNLGWVAIWFYHAFRLFFLIDQDLANFWFSVDAVVFTTQFSWFVWIASNPPMEMDKVYGYLAFFILNLVVGVGRHAYFHYPDTSFLKEAKDEIEKQSITHQLQLQTITIQKHTAAAVASASTRSSSPLLTSGNGRR